jgi:hypothetical protein
VSLLCGCPVELASQVHYSEDDIRTKLIDFIDKLKEVAVTDPISPTGAQLCDSEGYDQKLWTELPSFSLHCAEDIVSFGKSCEPDCPCQRCNLY